MQKKKKQPGRTVLDLEEYFPYWLASLSRLAAQRLQKRLQTETPFLTVAEWRLMAVVACNDRSQAVDISRLTRLDQVAVHRAVKSLTIKQLLYRKDCPEDKRRKLLILTGQGWSVYERVVPIAKAIEAEYLTLLAPNDRDALKALLKRLYEQSKGGGE